MDKGVEGSRNLDSFHGRHMCIIPNMSFVAKNIKLFKNSCLAFDVVTVVCETF